jgi:hypothetical protein
MGSQQAIPQGIPIDPATEADELVDIFNGLSQALDDFRLGPIIPPGTTADELERVKSLAQALEDLAHNFTAESIGATLRSVQASLDRIKMVTREAKEQLARLKDVSKAISIAAFALDIGTGIAEGNPASILTAAQDLAGAIMS